MKMRAKMCDGTPVTFECIDHGEVRFYDGVWDFEPFSGPNNRIGYCVGLLTEFIGEGFHVLNLSGRFAKALQRDEWDRLALERNGVDTATVEMWHSGAWQWIWSQEGPFPLRALPSDPDRAPPTEAMIAAGAAKLRDNLYSVVEMRGGIDVLLQHDRFLASTIYAAMERART